MSNNYLPSNPHFAFVDIKIGDTNITPIPPKHLEHFSYERTTRSDVGACNKIIMTLHDETALLLEYEIAKGNRTLEFKYGYVGGAASKTYSGTITEYDVDFQASGAVLNVEGISNGLLGVGDPKSVTYENMPMEDIIKEIAAEEGWVIDEDSIEPIEPIYEESDPTKYKTFYRSNMSGPQFINQVLSEYAMSKSGQGAYKLYFDDGVDSSVEGAKVYFKPDDYSSADNVFKDFELVWGSGIDSPVKSFNPNFSGILTSVLGGGEISVNIMNSLTNELFTVKYDKDTNTCKKVTGDFDVDRSKYRYTVGASSYTEAEAKRIAATMWYQNSAQSYPADLVLVGDPSLEPQTSISIAILNKEGLPHHSSGVYLIQTVVDDITGGTFESQCSLIRNGLTIGESDSGGINITVNAIDTSSADSSNGAIEGQSSLTTTPQSVSGQQAASTTDQSQKASLVTGGQGINRTGDTQAKCSALQTTITVQCRDENGNTYNKSLTVNKYLADNIKEIFADIYANTNFKIKSSSTGAYCYRNVSGTNKLSYHSYGIAIDINWGDNPYSKSAGGSDGDIKIRTENHPVVKIFKAHGWGWGGSYHDYMHFSYMYGW